MSVRVDPKTGHKIITEWVFRFTVKGSDGKCIGERVFNTREELRKAVRKLKKLGNFQYFQTHQMFKVTYTDIVGDNYRGYDLVR